MARQRRTSALTSLQSHEAGSVLNALLEAHPELIPEAERLATGLLDEAAWESVRDDVTRTLLSLPLEALNDRVGYHREYAARHRRIAALDHYAAAAQTWDYEGWQNMRAASKAPAA
jgi:hypothetical protein